MYSIAWLNVPLDTLQLVEETISQVRWPNLQLLHNVKLCSGESLRLSLSVAGKPSHHTITHCMVVVLIFVNLSFTANLTPPPYLHLATSQIWWWSGGRGILRKLTMLQYCILL